MTESPVEESSFTPSNIRSLRELIDLVSGRSIKDHLPQEDAGFAEVLPFPFLALVGQKEMKIALCLALINPEIGGVLLIGPRGQEKTTAVRSLIDLLPPVERSACFLWVFTRGYRSFRDGWGVSRLCKKICGRETFNDYRSGEIGGAAPECKT